MSHIHRFQERGGKKGNEGGKASRGRAKGRTRRRQRGRRRTFTLGMTVGRDTKGAFYSFPFTVKIKRGGKEGEDRNTRPLTPEDLTSGTKSLQGLLPRLSRGRRTVFALLKNSQHMKSGAKQDGGAIGAVVEEKRSVRSQRCEEGKGKGALTTGGKEVTSTLLGKALKPNTGTVQNSRRSPPRGISKRGGGSKRTM